MKAPLGILAACLACFALPANAALLTIVHALPPLPDAVPSNNPVDIAINKECTHTQVAYGSKLGPREVDRGKYLILFYESDPANPCEGTTLASINLSMSSSTEIDVVLGLTNRDRVGVSRWDNRRSLRTLARGAETVIEGRHVGASPTLRVTVQSGDGNQGRTEVSPGGRTKVFRTKAGPHILAVSKGSDVLDQDKGDLNSGRAYWSYITGSSYRNTINLLTTRSVPVEPGPGKPIEPKYNSCCAYGTCFQLSQAQCMGPVGGIYIGDTSCSPNPC